MGYKPTFGLINPQGVKSAAESLDTVGFMARTVEDVELSARVLTNSAPLAGCPRNAIRIGLCRTYAWDTAEKATQYAVEDAAQRLAKAGLLVTELDLPAQFNDLAGTRESSMILSEPAACPTSGSAP